ncbi:MAG: hypothetical protein HDS10_01230 [Bacteroides sp.]|nr:hypothetical protein [Bacteroides sp.]
MKTLDCGAGRRKGELAVAILLERTDLIYDIRNYCWIEGHIMPEGEQEGRHMVQDVGEEGNADRVTRMLDLVHADVVERLYPFTEKKLYNPVVDGRLNEKPVYGVVMNVPESFSQTTLNLLGKLIHELMVSLAVADWLSITNPAKEETWKGKAEGLINRINQVKNSRKDRVRIRKHWL